ncbi:MAG: ATP-binding protein [Deltaproteobacteria bacterium]|nr:ATP-binding protein [Deltaproteobacteria bacterium]
MNSFHLFFEIGSCFDYLPFLTRLFRALKAKKPYPLTQILVEAYNNAVVHAHHRNKNRWIGIDILFTPKMGRIRVSDSGKGLKSRKKSRSGLWGTRGRGMQLIEAYADRISHRHRNGRHIFEAIRYL